MWYRTSAGVILSLLLASYACDREKTLTPPSEVPQLPPERSGSPNCQGSVEPGGQEGEIIGSIFEGGLPSCSAWSVSLTPYADAQSHLHMASYKSTLTTDWHFGRMFEWWDPLAGVPCASSDGTLSRFLTNGSGSGEVPHATQGSQEGHCVRPGRYRFTGPGDGVFDVDYVQGSIHYVTNTVTQEREWVESAVYDPSNNGVWEDLVINRDITNVHPGDNPVLEIQTADPQTNDPYSPSFFTNDPAPSGTAETWFRFSTSRSVSNWTIDQTGVALARLYFDGTDLTQTTGYYTYRPENSPIIRLHRFPNPSVATKQYVVGLELMRPDEEPADQPTVTRTVTINRINPDLAPGTIVAPASANLGQPISITINERNLGANQFAPVEGGWTGKVYLSTDQVLSPGTDVLIDTYTESNPIPAGQTVQLSRSPVVPSNLAEATYYVIASLDANGTVIESNENNNVGVSGAVAIVTPVYASATFEGTTTWLNTDQILSSQNSTQGPNIRYRWRTDSGGVWTPYEASTQYEFLGHGSAGTHSVTLEVKNIVSGASATVTTPFTVQNSSITMTGPTFISVKGTYTYTASVSSNWWNRILPTQTWSGPIGPQTTWTRTWSAGCYEADVRADASGGGVLKRGRRHVIVAIGTGCPRP
jgi:CARDB